MRSCDNNASPTARLLNNRSRTRLNSQRTNGKEECHIVEQVYDDKKAIYIWLDSIEAQNEELKKSIAEKYRPYHDKKYMLVFFESGKGSLAENLSGLLRYNQQKQAYQEVKKQRKARDELSL